MLMLTLGSNSIVSIDVEAFGDLRALRINADDFNPTSKNGTEPYRDSYGIRTCGHNPALTTEPGAEFGTPLN